MAVEAADRNAEFVDALRKRGWDDTAVAYLEWVPNSPLATAEFGQELPYQKAQSLVAQAGAVGGRGEQKMLLADAAAEFQKFAQTQADSPLATDAMRQAANLHRSLGNATVSEAKLLPEQATAQRNELRRTALKSFDDAVAAAEQTVALCTKRLAVLPKPAAIQADPAAKALRDRLKSQQLEARYVLGLIDFDRAAAFEHDSRQFHGALDAAIKSFETLYQEFRGNQVGAASRVFQGRCFQEKGDFQKALGCYEDVTRQRESSEEFRPWMAAANRYSIECLLELKKVDEAAAVGQDWLAASSPAERGRREWLEVAFRLAGAYQTKIESLPDGGAEAKRLQSETRDLYRQVSQQPNDFQQEARLALATRGGSAASAADLKTFADAYAAGKSALEVMSSSQLAIRLARDNNPEAIPELEEQVKQNKADSLELLEAALDRVDRETPVEELNEVRYFLCWLYLQDGRYDEAAVLGEFLATRYPENQNAASAAGFALAAIEQLPAAPAAEEGNGGGDGPAPSDPTSFRSRKLAGLAELIATRWPKSAAAPVATSILINAALREDQLDQAEAMIARLPEDGRAAAQLSLGSGLWVRYVRLTAGANEPPSETALALRDKAGELLTGGFAGIKDAGEPNAGAATGALYLVQYLLARGDAAGALKVLEDDAVGPLVLVQSEAEAASRPEYVLETYKSALRTYLSVEPPKREEAGEMMTALEGFAAKQEAGGTAQQLTRIYLGLGLQLQRQVKELTVAGEDAKAKHVAAAFEDVLERVAARPDANDWAIRSWLAQTNLQIGEGLRGEEAKKYLERARKSYEAILAESAKNEKYAPDAAALLAARMRLGDCLLALGQYSKGVDQYAAILLEKPNVMPLQQAAAAALQQWGVSARDPKALDRAIRGDVKQKNGENLIWGWVKLAVKADMGKRQTAKAADADPAMRERMAQYDEIFYQARYNVAHARFLAAKMVAGDARRAQLEAAQKNIDSMRQLYPDLGGPNWKPKFEDLHKQIVAELAKR